MRAVYLAPSRAAGFAIGSRKWSLTRRKSGRACGRRGLETPVAAQAGVSSVFASHELRDSTRSCHLVVTRQERAHHPPNDTISGRAPPNNLFEDYCARSAASRVMRSACETQDSRQSSIERFGPRGRYAQSLVSHTSPSARSLSLNASAVMEPRSSRPLKPPSLQTLYIAANPLLLSTRNCFSAEGYVSLSTR